MSAAPGDPRFAEPASGPRSTPGFGGVGALVGAILVIVVVAGLVWSAAGGPATASPHPRLFGGSLVLDDHRAPTVIDVATGAVTVRLDGVYVQVGASSYADVQAVPVQGGTLLVNRRTGAFNFLGLDNYVVDSTGAGIGLGALAGSTAATAFAAGSAAYIVRSGPHSTVSLVDRATVAAGTRSQQAGSAAVVPPRGFAPLGGSVATQPGATAVDGAELWTLVSAATGCRVVRLTPVASGHDGLQAAEQATFHSPCADASLETGSAGITLATPGQVRLYHPGPPGALETTSDVSVPATRPATLLRPVTASDGAWTYLARLPTGWALFSVGTDGRADPLLRLTRLGPSADPVTPVMSRGRLFTLDQTASGAPTLWQIDPATAAMTPVPGEARYPAKATEQATFGGAQVLVDGPRVVFNNPDSLLAVVVFTDGTHAPVTVDKSTALDVSAVGPGDVDAHATPSTTAVANPNAPSPVAPATTVAPPTPVPQAVNQQVTCANTLQKPYAPQITVITPATDSATVAWSYQLLDQQDCEPDSWSVHVTALGGATQPAAALQTVNGQDQLQFMGLRPSTSYQVTVTAYINRQSTSSAPATFTTEARGPDPPTAVQTTADDKGDWIISWTPCVPAACGVSADTWTVIGTACGSGYVGQPPTVEVPGSQTTLTVSAANLNLLGTSLSFNVEGSTASGLVGDPTSDHACTMAWQPPNAADIALTASGTASGQTVTATLAVTTTVAAVQAFGSSQTNFTYQVGGVTVGPTTKNQVTVPDLPPGTTFTPTVVIAPVGHPDASLTVQGPSFSQTLTWPALGLATTSTVDPTQPNTGTVNASFSGLPPGTFDAAGQLTCGSTQTNVGGGINGTSLALSGVNLVTMGGSCQLVLTVTDTASPDPYGTAAPPLNAAVQIGTQPGYTFVASYGAGCLVPCDQFVVGYDGKGEPPAGGAWTVTVASPVNPTNPTCQVVNGPTADPAFPVAVDLPALCDPTMAAISVSYEYLGETQSVTVAAPASPPPTTTAPTTVAPTTTTIPVTTTTRPVTTTTKKPTTTTTRRPTTTTTRRSTTSTTRRRTASGVGHDGPVMPERTVLAASTAPAGPGAATLDWTLAVLVGAALLLTVGDRRYRRMKKTLNMKKTRNEEDPE